MKIIIINGQGGSGKDSFVKACGLVASIYNVSMVDDVKQVAYYAGWGGGKELKDRKFLSDLKDLLEEYNDYPFRHVVRSIEDEIIARQGEVEDLLIFIHAREPKDIKRWKQSYGAKSLLIRRPDIEGQYGNHADDGVFDIEYDWVIMNDSDLWTLIVKATNFAKKLEEEDWESYL